MDIDQIIKTAMSIDEAKKMMLEKIYEEGINKYKEEYGDVPPDIDSIDKLYAPFRTIHSSIIKHLIEYIRFLQYNILNKEAKVEEEKSKELFPPVQIL